MKQEFTEESVIFASIIKWLVLSTLTGVFVGLASAFFLKVLNWSIQLSNVHLYYFVLLPAGLSLSIIVRHFSGEQARGLGAEIEAVHKHECKIKPITVPLKLIATVMLSQQPVLLVKKVPVQKSAQAFHRLYRIFSNSVTITGKHL